MRLVLNGLWIGLCAVALGCATVAAEDFPDEAYAEVAKATGDARTPAQIRKDNELVEAASKGNVAKVKEALKDGADVNARYIDMRAFLSAGYGRYTPLMLASVEGHAEVVQVLIDAKADLNLERNGRTSLYHAVNKERAVVIELLTKAGAKGDVEKVRLGIALIEAACIGFELKPGNPYPAFPGSRKSATGLTIEAVLAKGADVNTADPEGFTALMYAANLGLSDNVEVLLKHGADVKLAAKNGDTALSLIENSAPRYAPEVSKKVIELLKAAPARTP